MHRLPRGRLIALEGKTRVFTPRPGSPVILGLRQGRVRYIGVRNMRALRTKRALKRYLRRVR